MSFMACQVARERVLAFTFVILLSMIALLGGHANAPMVPIRQLHSMDQYSEVRIEGMLVDLWVRDDGSELLVLLDPSGAATAKVVCACGVTEQPSSLVGVGDILRVRGELAGVPASPTIYSQSDWITVIKTAEHVLSITVLSRNWPLFQGDRLDITGVLVLDDISSSARLFDSSGKRSIALRCDGFPGRFTGSEVIITGILRFDSYDMSLFIEVESISEAPR